MMQRRNDPSSDSIAVGIESLISHSLRLVLGTRFESDSSHVFWRFEQDSNRFYVLRKWLGASYVSQMLDSNQIESTILSDSTEPESVKEVIRFNPAV